MVVRVIRSVRTTSNLSHGVLPQPTWMISAAQIFGDSVIWHVSKLVWIGKSERSMYTVANIDAYMEVHQMTFGRHLSWNGRQKQCIHLFHYVLG